MIIDGGADLSKEIRDQYRIEMVPLKVFFGEEEYPSTLDEAFFYDKMKENESLPTTSSPSPDEFLSLIEQLGNRYNLLIVTISSGLSSTYHHAKMAAASWAEKNPLAKIAVIDSKTATAGLGLIAYEAAKMIHQGIAFDALVKTVMNKAEKVKTIVFLDSLENLIKGGRLDRIRGKIASMLNVKLMMGGNSEGKIEVLEKVRGTQKAIRFLIDQIGALSQTFEEKVLSITHGNCEEMARGIIGEILARYPFKEVIMNHMGPAIGVHAGRGGICIAFEGKDR